MKVLKAERFTTHQNLLKFVAENKIQREDILTITDYSSFTLFYYAIE